MIHLLTIGLHHMVVELETGISASRNEDHTDREIDHIDRWSALHPQVGREQELQRV